MSTQQSSGENRTIAQVVEKRLSSDILYGRFVPDSRLRLGQLSSLYASGMSPLREALAQLVGKGLVIQDGQRGFRVAPVSQVDLLDVTQTRIRLETMALLLAIESGEADWEASILAAHHRLIKRSRTEDLLIDEVWENLHRDFHFSLIAACGSMRLLSFCDEVFDHFDRYRRVAVVRARRHPSLSSDHSDIVDMVLAREAKKAADLLRAHVEKSASEITILLGADGLTAPTQRMPKRQRGGPASDSISTQPNSNRPASPRFAAASSRESSESKGESKMSSHRRLNRRGFLGAGASAVAAAGMPWFGPTPVSAATLDAAPFQLSWIKSMQYGGYFAGIDQGIFKKHGIDAVFNSGGPNIDPIASVASGQSVLGDRPIGSLLIARDKGIPIKVIGTVFAKSPFCVISLTSKPVRSVKELEGKTISVSTSARPLFMYLLKSAGVDPKSVTFLPASPDPSILMTGQVGAIAGYSTNQGVLLQAKGADLFMLNVQDLGVPETTGTIYAREDFLEKNRDLVVRYLKAASESWRWALDHAEETTKLMMEKYGAPGLAYKASITEMEASKPFIEAGPRGPNGLLALDLSLYAKIIEVYRKVDMIKTDMKVTDVCDDSFINAALAS